VHLGEPSIFWDKSIKHEITYNKKSSHKAVAITLRNVLCLYVNGPCWGYAHSPNIWAGLGHMEDLGKVTRTNLIVIGSSLRRPPAQLPGELKQTFSNNFGKRNSRNLLKIYPYYMFISYSLVSKL